MTAQNELDQFYTRPEVAEYCYTILNSVMNECSISNPIFIEPSAGTGAFLKVLETHNQQYKAYDKEPKYSTIIEQDFLQLSAQEFSNNNTNYVIIGNPPFGKRSKLAIEFVNHSLRMSNIVGFILPVQFNKFFTQKNIDKQAKLIVSTELPVDSFIENGKIVNIRCVFQIWVKNINTSYDDLRIKQAPVTTHNDFEMYTYNCTPGALKYFDYDWDFAVRRQGWGELNIILHKDKTTLDKRKQYMFFKASNSDVLHNLLQIDFTKLGEKNTSVGGFGKADVVEEYNKLYNNNTTTTTTTPIITEQLSLFD